MDGFRFDDLTRLLAVNRSRHELTRLFGRFTLSGSLALLRMADAEAKRKRKKACPPCKKRKQGKCKGNQPLGTPCEGGRCDGAGTCISPGGSRPAPAVCPSIAVARSAAMMAVGDRVGAVVPARPARREVASPARTTRPVPAGSAKAAPVRSATRAGNSAVRATNAAADSSACLTVGAVRAEARTSSAALAPHVIVAWRAAALSPASGVALPGSPAVRPAGRAKSD